MSNEITLCGRCGKRVEDQLLEKYDEADLEDSLRWCESCIDDTPTAIEELFEKIEDALSEENAKEFRDFDKSMKAATSLEFIQSGAITGGTIGHLETLRIIVASGLEVD